MNKFLSILLETLVFLATLMASITISFMIGCTLFGLHQHIHVQKDKIYFVPQKLNQYVIESKEV